MLRFNKTSRNLVSSHFKICVSKANDKPVIFSNGRNINIQNVIFYACHKMYRLTLNSKVLAIEAY